MTSRSSHVIKTLDYMSLVCGLDYKVINLQVEAACTVSDFTTPPWKTDSDSGR